MILSEPGLYDLTMAEYLADPAPEPSFSASCGKLLLQMSPKHAWLAHPRLGNARADPPNAKADFGSVVHELVLGNGSQVQVIDVPDFRGKRAQLRDDALAEGFIPMKPPEFERAQAAAAAIRSQIPNVFEEGRAEQTMLWRDGDIWCRARPDWLVQSANMAFDLKLTGINLSPLEKNVERHIYASDQWYDFTVAHYMDGYHSLFGQELAYRFLFVENRPPFSIRPFLLTGQGREMGQRKLKAARSLFKRCMKDNKWPRMALELGYADPEPWQATGWLTYGNEPSEFATATAMQAPLEDEK